MSDVDLPSFPLLRIDQIHIHDTTTLIEPEAQLTALENEEAMESISQFVSKSYSFIYGGRWAIEADAG